MASAQIPAVFDGQVACLAHWNAPRGLEAGFDHFLGELMGFWGKLADRMILEPSRDVLDPGPRSRVIIPLAPDSQELAAEAWVLDSEQLSIAPRELTGTAWAAIKFPGAAGRAERAGPHPCELVSDSFQVWAINPPGYGSSSGEASLQHIPTSNRACFDAFATATADCRRVAFGNSLGTMSALQVASENPSRVDALFLRNCVPLRHIVLGQYSWWNLGIGSSLVAAQIPPDLDPIRNAESCKTPAFFVVSEYDTVIPPKYQQKIIDAYAGPKVIFTLRGANHHDRVSNSQALEYAAAVREFLSSIPSDATASKGFPSLANSGRATAL